MSRLLQDLVTAQAQLRPEAVAVVSDGQSLTYGDLEILSNQIARILIDSGCKRGDRVCLLMPKNFTAIAAIVGIYKADCVYVPLDLTNPASRLSRIVLNCETHCIVTTSDAASKLEEILEYDDIRSSIVIGWLDTEFSRRTDTGSEFSLKDVLTCSSQAPHYRNRSNDPAHILFTSGSTGDPKGVVITHGNVIEFISWAIDYFQIDSDDRLSGHPPLNFDLSVFDIFGALSSGAELHLVPSGLSLLPHKLTHWIREAKLTQWFSVPSLLNYLAKFDVIRDRDFPSLRRVIWCGEVFPTPSLIYWMKRLPHVQFTNLYGPTETTIASSYYTVPECPADETQPIPIGQACRGEELLVLNEGLSEVQQGQMGELYIRGSGLSPGYWKDPVKTSEVFLPDPDSPDQKRYIYKTGDLARFGDDGLVYYLGRSDTQIKSRGYRIELGEIETVLSTLHYLKESVVVALPTHGFENVTICCAYVVSDREDLGPVDFRNDLSRALPYYMIPSHWKSMDGLPRNANGKIDRKRIKGIFEQDATHTDQ